MKKSIFGIKNIIINNTVVSTYQVMVKDNPINENILLANNVLFTKTNTGKLQCCHTSTNYIEFDSKVQRLGKALK